MADIAAAPAEPILGVPYPTKTKTVVGNVNGISTEAEVTYFRDKILVVISQAGRLAQWESFPPRLSTSIR